MDHRPEMQLLGGEQRKAFGQVDAHLVPEDAPGSGPGAVALLDAVFQNVAEQIQVDLHGSDGSRAIQSHCSRPEPGKAATRGGCHCSHGPALHSGRRWGSSSNCVD